MKRIDLNTAAKQHWGAIIVGTSFAAMFFARSLRRISPILLIEKGSWLSHAEQLSSRQLPEEKFVQRNRSDSEKTWHAHTLFGGNSNCWWGCTPRFHPDDFALHSLHGVGRDWPLAYDELEPFYCEAEEIMQISGGGSELLMPRSRPFPSPAHTPSRTDRVLRAQSPLWFAMPTARSNGPARPKCCANGVCGLCPIDSKFTILNGLSHFERPDLSLLLQTEARSLRVEAGNARAISVRGGAGAERELRAELFALGANAISNPAILLRSGFHNPHIGKHLHEQLGQWAWLDIDAPNYFGGTSITGHGYEFYAGAHRSQVAAVLVENWNAPPSLRLEPGRWTQRVMFRLIAENLPQAENAVKLENDEPVLEWSGHSPYAVAGLARARAQLAGSLPFAVEAQKFSDCAPTETHIQGTTRMARRREDGVVDRDLVAFEARNVLCLGAGTFPSCSPANPTLTLCALSIRAARAVA